MPKYRPLGKLIPIFLLSTFWSSFVVIYMLFRMVLAGGPKKYFSVKKRQRTPVLDNPELGTHGFLTLKTLKIHYVANGEEGKPLMLFLHGYPEFWYSWRHQLKEFGKDYRAVAIDMRGYGESDKPSGVSEYHLDKLSRDVKEVIEALGYEKAIVVAHDWGGFVAGKFATQYPNVMERLVLCNIPHLSAFQKKIRTSWRQALLSWYMMFFQMPWLPEIITTSEDLRAMDLAFTLPSMGGARTGFGLLDLEAFKYNYGQPGAMTPPLNYYRALWRYEAISKTDNRRVFCPTLIIWGTRDVYLATDMAEMSLEYCQDGRVEYVENTSHWVQQEQPKIVNNLIREFLATEKAG